MISRIQKDGIVRRAVKRTGRDAPEVYALLHKLPQRRAEGIPPVGRLLFAPAGMVVARREFGGCLPDETSRLVKDGRLASASAVVDAKEKPHLGCLAVFHAPIISNGKRSKGHGG